MKTLIDHLANYASYHRHVRNVATHFVGIPTIVVSVMALLGRASVDVGDVTLSLATLTWLASTLFFLRLDVRYGLTMAVLTGLSVWAGHALAALPTTAWLSSSLGLFFGGWVLQFIGHWYEGRKPAFVDDLVGLVIGPLFVVAEAGFLMGLRREVQDAVEARVGPVSRLSAQQRAQA
ncbi:MAG: DUF962 domain-containing protein [Proteobacteria bacterium]|uniref:DUF962 domain-containing protein n=1 Tax=Aquabacterium sp. TaxID=1872578 RepID=UPI0035C73E54|nr:DUF962 domain-containing protein [Pseudomonadota bacterium]